MFDVLLRTPTHKLLSIHIGMCSVIEKMGTKQHKTKKAKEKEKEEEMMKKRKYKIEKCERFHVLIIIMKCL